MGEITFEGFKVMAEDKTSLFVSTHKEKASYLMIDWYDDYYSNDTHYGSGIIAGPEVGHSVSNWFWVFSIDGWAYGWLNREWHLIMNGAYDFRRGDMPIKPDNAKVMGYDGIRIVGMLW